MKYLIVLMIIVINSGIIFSQTKIQKPENNELPKDTNFVFESPRPLVKGEAEFRTFNYSWGMDVLFSNSGFGLGLFYNYKIAKNWNIYSRFFISGARNTDEFEYFNPFTNQTFIEGKINRLYMAPLTFGVERMIFTESLSEGIRPFLDGGFGATFIFSTPYSKDFFEAFKYIEGYTRPAAYLGAGVYVGGEGKTLMSINARYYYIPFGGNGLESIQGNPIKDFGGLFLSLSIGTKF